MKNIAKYKTAYVTVDGTTTSYTFALPTNHSGNLALQFEDITNLTGVLTVSFDGGTDYFNVESVTSAGVVVAAGGTHTAVDGESLYFDAPTATHAKYTRSAGDGALRIASFYDAGGSIYSILRAIKDAGITSTSNAEKVDDATFTPATSSVSVIGAFADETSPDSVDEGDAGAVRMTPDRRLRVETTNGTVTQPKVDSYGHVAINLTTGANQVLVSSAASKQIWVYGYKYTVGDADGQTVSFQDEDDVALSGIVEHVRYGGAAVAPSGNFAMPIWKLGTDKDLEVDITGGDVDGWLAYAIVSV